MHSPQPLPDALGAAFTVAHARELGLGARRLRGADLDAPFHGVRRIREDAATDAAERLCALALAFATKMTEHEFFSHATAAALWGIPLPVSAVRGPGVDVAVFSPRRNARGRGVRGHEVEPRLASVTRHPVHGVPLVTPAAAWAMLGGLLRDPYDLVAAGDALIRRPQHAKDPPAMATAAQLGAAVAAGRRVGVIALRGALPRIRAGSSSRPETWTRLTLVDHGLPEPELAWEVRDPAGYFIARLDMAYPRWRVAIEYEGSQHLLDHGQWTRDILRYDRLAAEGWRVIRVTKEELFNRPAELAARVRDALRRAGA